jgi:hypothetical protein
MIKWLCKKNDDGIKYVMSEVITTDRDMRHINWQVWATKVTGDCKHIAVFYSKDDAVKYVNWRNRWLFKRS